MGGTIARLAAEGHRITTLIMTDGCTAQYRHEKNLQDIIKQKKSESEKANALLGVDRVIFGDLPDMKLDTVPHIEVNAVIEKTVRDVKPACIYTHFYGDLNLDHQMTYRSSIVAARPVYTNVVRHLYLYRVASCTEWTPGTTTGTFLPNHFVSIEPYMDVKLNAIKAYQTEIRDFPHPRSLEAVESYDKAVGIAVGVNYAEQFMMVRSTLV